MRITMTSLEQAIGLTALPAGTVFFQAYELP